MLAQKFGALIKEHGCFVSLYGEIGAGKTAFTKLLLKFIGVNKTVTSPSFVILNEYHGNHLPVYHFDLYRLENEGVESILSELVEYSKQNVITLVEWANFGQEELPIERVNITVLYGEKEEARDFIFEGVGQRCKKIVDRLAKDIKI